MVESDNELVYYDKRSDEIQLTRRYETSDEKWPRTRLTFFIENYSRYGWRLLLGLKYVIGDFG